MLKMFRATFTISIAITAALLIWLTIGITAFNMATTSGRLKRYMEKSKAEEALYQAMSESISEKTQTDKRFVNETLRQAVPEGTLRTALNATIDQTFLWLMDKEPSPVPTIKLVQDPLAFKRLLNTLRVDLLQQDSQAFTPCTENTEADKRNKLCDAQDSLELDELAMFAKTQTDSNAAANFIKTGDIEPNMVQVDDKEASEIRNAYRFLRRLPVAMLVSTAITLTLLYFVAGKQRGLTVVGVVIVIGALVHPALAISYLIGGYDPAAAIAGVIVPAEPNRLANLFGDISISLLHTSLLYAALIASMADVIGLFLIIRGLRKGRWWESDNHLSKATIPVKSANKENSRNT